MTEDDLYQMLDERGVPYEVYHHKAIFTVAEGDAVGIPELGTHTKNLFLRDDKKRNYYVVTADENQQVDLKALAKRIPSRRLSFAREEQLEEKLGLTAGAVTPFGILNDESREVTMVFDEGLRGKRIDAHPLVNTATMYIEMDDLVSLLAEHGNPVVFCELGPADVAEVGPRG
jgi:Ala-tRNA(Pro) deacylase